MNSRQRLQATLNHQPPDRLCVDFGAGFQTGMGVAAVHRLRQAMLGEEGHRVKVIEPYQMLGEIDEALRQSLHLDVVGIQANDVVTEFDGEKITSSIQLISIIKQKSPGDVCSITVNRPRSAPTQR